MTERMIRYYIHGTSFIGSCGLMYLALKAYEFAKYGYTQL